MIDIDNLKLEDQGRGLIFTDDEGKKLKGRLKSWSRKWLWCVFGKDSTRSDWMSCQSRPCWPAHCEFIEED